MFVRPCIAELLLCSAFGAYCNRRRRWRLQGVDSTTVRERVVEHVIRKRTARPHRTRYGNQLSPHRPARKFDLSSRLISCCTQSRCRSQAHHDFPLSFLCIASSQICTGSKDGTCRVWSLASMRMIGEIACTDTAKPGKPVLGRPVGAKLECRGCWYES
jgi:WD40 repeat protein